MQRNLFPLIDNYGGDFAVPSALLQTYSSTAFTSIVPSGTKTLLANLGKLRGSLGSQPGR